MFLLGLGPVYTLRNRIEPLPVGQYIDDARVNVAFVIVHLAVIALLARRLPALSTRAIALLAGLHVLVVASALWSLAPARSLTQGVLFALTTAAALVVGDRLGVRGLVTALAASSQAGVLASQLAVRRGWPNTFDRNGDWAGIYLNRNSLGPVAVLAILATAAAMWLWWVDGTSPDQTSPAQSRSVRSMFTNPAHGLAAIGLAAALAVDAHTLVRSASLTPMVGAGVALATVVVALGLPPMLRRTGGVEQPTPGMLAAGVATTWVGLAGLALLTRSEVSTSLDRSATLSGRTELWGWLIDAASRRPLVGWGWLGVWEDRALEAEVVGRFDVDFSTAHNSMIEMLLAAGVVGAVLLAATAAALVWPPIRLAMEESPGRNAGVVALGLLGYVAAVNQLETYVGANLVPWALLVGLAAAAGRHLARGGASGQPAAAGAVP